MGARSTETARGSHGDTPVEVMRLQAGIMGRLHPDHRTREALRMSSALLRSCVGEIGGATALQ